MALRTLVLAGIFTCISCWTPTDPDLQKCPAGRQAYWADDGCKKTGFCDPDDPPSDGIVTNREGVKSCKFDCEFPFCNSGGICNCISKRDLKAIGGCGALGCLKSRGEGAQCVDPDTLEPIQLGWQKLFQGICVCRPGFCTVCGACAQLGVPEMAAEMVAAPAMQALPTYMMLLAAGCFAATAAVGLIVRRRNSGRNGSGDEPLLREHARGQ